MINKELEDKIKEVCHKGAIFRVKYLPCLFMWSCKIVKAVKHKIEFDETNEIISQTIGKDLNETIKEALGSMDSRYNEHITPSDFTFQV